MDASKTVRKKNLLIVLFAALAVITIATVLIVQHLTKKQDPSEPVFTLTQLPVTASAGITHEVQAPVAARISDPTQWRSTAALGGHTKAWETLQAHGGENVQLLYVDSPCGRTPNLGESSGCVDPEHNNTIFVDRSIFDIDDRKMQALVVHELAHVYQLKLDSKDYLNENEAVQDAYQTEMTPIGLPLAEPLADCMTVASLGYSNETYASECTPDQLKIAQQVWDGVTP